MIVTGAAPASPTVLGFLRAALGCQVSQGQGAGTAYGASMAAAGLVGTQRPHGGDKGWPWAPGAAETALKTIESLRLEKA